MTNKTRIASAGNVLPGAFACLRQLGFTLYITPEGLWQAESASSVLVADDPLTLLGLAKLHELRGDDWRPADAEVDAYLAFDLGSASI